MHDIYLPLVQCRTFLANQHILQNWLRISDYEAQSLLLQEILDHRLQGYSNTDSVIRAIDSNDSKILWQITNARKKLIERMNSKSRKNYQVIYNLKMLSSHTYTINLDDPRNLDDDTKQKVIKLLPQLFREKSTREYIKCVLTVGKEETMDIFNMNAKQFNKKLKNIEYFCKTHREKFVNLVVSKEDAKLLKESGILTELENYISSDNYSAELFQSLINKHKDYLDDILGDYQDYPINPVRLLNDFINQPHIEQYKLVNCISDRLKEVDDKLDDSAQMRSTTM